jgi:hypothetical protein
MVALLKDNGEFTPRPVVRDTSMLKQLVDSMQREPQAPKGLVEALRRVREKQR